MSRHETFEEAIGACMKTLAKLARSDGTMHELEEGARGFVHAWATEHLYDGTPIKVELTIQRGERYAGDSIASATLTTDAPPAAISARRSRSLPRGAL